MKTAEKKIRIGMKRKLVEYQLRAMYWGEGNEIYTQEPEHHFKRQFKDKELTDWQRNKLSSKTTNFYFFV